MNTFSIALCLKMNIYSICWWLLLFGKLQTVSTKQLCDIRKWYLNLITNDVFNIDLNDKQLELKNSIETLVLNSSDKPESRMKECHVLDMYNEMLKETFDYAPSNANILRENEVKNKDIVITTDDSSESTEDVNSKKDIEENASERNPQNLDLNKEVVKDDSEVGTTAQEDLSDLSVLNTEAKTKDEKLDFDTGKGKNMVTEVNDYEAVPQNEKQLGKNADEDDHISTFLETENKDEMDFDDIDESSEGENNYGLDEMDETEIVDDNEELVEEEDDLASEQMVLETDPSESDNSTGFDDDDVFVTRSIPFGVCWSFGCLRSEIFDPFGLDRLDPAIEVVPWKTVVKPIKTLDLSVKSCYSNTTCSKLCYFVLSTSYCILEYETDFIHEHTKNNFDVTILDELHGNILNGHETKSNDGDSLDWEYSKHEKSKTVEDILTTQYAELDSKDNNLKNFEATEKLHTKHTVSEHLDHKEQPFMPIKDPEKSLSVDDFEKLINQKTTDYSHKIQALELMIVNLEKQLLLEKLNKQNHSSEYTRLENMVLRLENDLLKMYKYYENLKDETDTMSKKQTKYLEIAHNRESDSKKPALSGGSEKEFELISKHQAKIGELTEILRNQSTFIQHMKHRQDSLEEQNRMLHQMVMNQTIFMTSIIQTVQDLSEQNSKNKQEMQTLQQKLDNAVKRGGLPKSNDGEEQGKNMLETVESYTSYDKIQNHDIKEQALVHNVNEIQVTGDFFKKWCPTKPDTTPAISYNSVFIQHCSPYRKLFWHASGNNWGKSKTFLPVSPDVDDMTLKQVPLKSESLKLSDEYKSRKAKSDQTGIDMARTDLSPHTERSKDGSDSQSETGFETYKNANIKDELEQTIDNAVESIPVKEDVNEENVNEALKSKMLYTIPIENSENEEIQTQEKTQENIKGNDISNERFQSDNEVNTRYENEKLDSENEINYARNKRDDIAQPDKDKKNDVIIKENEKEQIIVGYDATGQPVMKDKHQHKDEFEENTKDGLKSIGEDAKPISKEHALKDDSPVKKEIENQEDDKKDETAEKIAVKAEIPESNEIKTAVKKQQDKSEDQNINSTGETKDVQEAVKEGGKDSGSVKDNKSLPEKEISTQNQDVQAKRGDESISNTGKSETVKGKKRMEPVNIGKDKQKEPKDCYEIYSRGSKGDGIYKLKPLGSNKIVEVFCDMKKGGWTVIQRRQDGTTNFFTEWDDYKKGFGGLYGEHWIGNDNIHLFTNQDYYKLRVDLIDWSKNKKYAEFDYFLVENEEEGYRLHIDDYSGDAGDGLTKHNGYKFSTKDVDNDKVVKEFGGSCANRFHGAGWYYKCYSSNLNGKYYKGGKIPEKKFDGVTWKPWTGPNYSLKKVVMKIRPVLAEDRT